MANYKFYDNYNDGRYLELHDNHTLWKISVDVPEKRYNDEIELLIWDMERHYKDLKVFMLGRSGRHICVEDTPANRRRYRHLVSYAEKLEQEIVDYFNNEYKGE